MLICRNWLLIVLITSDSLSGKFGFSTNQQVQSATDGAFSTDVMKRTSAYFKFILYSTAVLALVRYIYYEIWLTVLGLLDVWFISLNLVFCSVVGGSKVDYLLEKTHLNSVDSVGKFTLSSFKICSHVMELVIYS